MLLFYALCDLMYEGRLESSWSRLITSSRNFVEVRWRSHFRSTSLGKRCTSDNAPPTYRKRAADRWSLQNFLPLSSLFMVEKAQKSHGGEIWTVWRMFWWGSTDPLFPNRTQNSIQISPRAFWGFSNHEKGAPMQEISRWSTACSTFSKKRPSPHLHKVPTRSNKVSSRTLQTAFVCWNCQTKNSVLWSYSLNFKWWYDIIVVIVITTRSSLLISTDLKINFTVALYGSDTVFVP
jgi:hypothetical protein